MLSNLSNYKAKSRRQNLKCSKRAQQIDVAARGTKANLLVGYASFSVVSETSELSATVVLVVDVVGDVFEVLKVSSYHHVAERDEITMFEVFD